MGLPSALSENTGHADSNTVSIRLTFGAFPHLVGLGKLLMPLFGGMLVFLAAWQEFLMPRLS